MEKVIKSPIFSGVSAREIHRNAQEAWTTILRIMLDNVQIKKGKEITRRMNHE